MSKVHLTLSFVLISFGLFSQVNYTAKDLVTPFDGHFRPACNLGSYTSFSQEDLVNLSAGNPDLGILGVGTKALRLGLFDEFTSVAGYEDQLPLYEHIQALGVEENNLIVGFPSEAHQDTAYYCPIHRSQLFANLYEPIWDNGENGTPVNDNNDYALYLWNVVNLYKDYVRFWEIWNEPGFDFTGGLGWLPPGAPGNWWENNPDPCDYKLRAPIFHYIRLLRISWEIIKSTDPDGYVVVSGTGFPAFLDAILRNTDNPEDGSISAEYPHKGGAYFDVMGYHAYPHFDGSLQQWNDEIQDWDYFRHSDGAAEGLLATRDTFDLVLDDHGYNGVTYPEKLWMITECNLPRKAFGDFIGSAEAQRNFLIKAIVTLIENDIWQLQVFKLAEDTDFENAYMEFDLMGLYKRFDYNNLYFQEANDEGIAFKTASDLLFGKTYDPERTALLNLEENIRGAAFRDQYGNYSYVMWAKTETDMSEEASAIYSFPSQLNVGNLVKRTWDNGYAPNSEMISAQNIELTGAPIFLSERIFEINNTGGCAPFQVQLSANEFPNAETYLWLIEGGTPVSSTLPNPELTIFVPGTYHITLYIFDENEDWIAIQEETLILDEAPHISFDQEITGPIARFANQSNLNSNSFHWDFGDGSFSDEPNPTHLYLASGSYEVILTGENECGIVSDTNIVEVIAPSISMIDSTANDRIPEYSGVFRPSTNHEFYAGWTDEEMANIVAGNIDEDVQGIGVKSLRATIGEAFLEGWGYDFKKPTYQHYSNVDLQGNSFILDFPSEGSQDPIFYCPDHQSTLFKDIYTEIWDNGENGTPINDDNPFAVYVYQTVLNYGEFVDFWEVFSSPDFDFTGDYGWLPPGEPGNWWESNPDPCDYALRAPIFYYVRLLRVSYEIIKNYDPDSYVTISGIAFPSFLDAILRNTDNPLNGEVVEGYPLKGGAYFDAVGFKSYPHFDGSTIYFDLDIGTFAFERHSDAAVSGIPRVKNNFEEVLESYGYDGNTYPKKEWIISEANIPRKPFGDFLGGDLVQINWVMKAWVECARNDIRRLNIHRLAESHTFEEAIDAFQIIGLFQKIEGTTPYNQVPNNEAIALGSTSKMLFGLDYDAAKSAQLELPEEIDGAAFIDGEGNYVYVLWAKTKFDQNEGVTANYSFPASFNFDQVYKRDWYYSLSNNVDVTSAENIDLNGTPIFLTEVQQIVQPPISNFEASTVQICGNETITFEDLSINQPTEWQWSFPGGSPSFSEEANPSITYSTAGAFDVILTVTNASGSHTKVLSNYIEVEGLPVADYEIEVNNNQINISNSSLFADGYIWFYGDGTTDGAFQPEHTYFSNGEYTVQLIAFNECGNDTLEQTIQIEAAPLANFNIFPIGDCEEHLFNFVDASQASPNDWNWTFQGGSPSFSNSQFPMVEYSQPGAYQVILEVSNDFGTSEKVINIYVEGNIEVNNPISLCEGDLFQGIEIYSDTLIVDSLSTLALGCDSIVLNQIEISETIASNLFIDLCEGESYNDIFWETDTLLIDHFVSVNGCDSVVFTDISVFDSYVVQIVDSIEFGQSYEVGDSLFTESGEYEISLTASNGCDSLIFLDLTVFIIDDIENRDEISHFTSFPNPFKDKVNLYIFLNQAQWIDFQIFDVSGKKYPIPNRGSTLNKGENIIEFDLRQVPAGMYYIRIQGERKGRTIKVVKM